MTSILARLYLALFALPAGAAIPVEEFARHPQYDEVQISPDGEYLAVAAGVDGKRVLSLIRLADMHGVNVRPRGADELAGFTWAGPRRLLYSVGTRVGGLERPVSTGEIFGVDADGGNAAVLFGFRIDNKQAGTNLNKALPEKASARIVSTLPDDPAHVVIAVTRWNGGGDTTMPELRRLDVRDGTTVPMFLAPLREPEFLADHRGNVRFAYGEDAKGNFLVFHREAKTDGWEPVLDEQRDRRRAVPLAFDRTDVRAYWGCGSTDAVGALCTWTPDERHFDAVWSDRDAAIDELVTSLDGRDVVGVRTMPGRVNLGVLDRQADSIALLRSLMDQFAGDDVRIVSASRDGSRAVVLVESDVNPGEYYLYDRKSHQVSLLMQRWPALKPGDLAPMEPIEFKTRDGLVLCGYLTRPPGQAEAKNLPLVVLVHGGPYGARDRWAYDPDTQLLASRGYAVLRVNFRGSGGRGYGFVRAGHGEWGGRMQDDLTDATRWAIEQGIADPQRIGIMGASYGGYAALEGAVEEPDLYRCAIGYAAPYDLRMLLHGGDVAQRTSGANFLKRVLGEDEALLAARSPITRLDRLKASVMLIVGGADRRVPPEQGVALHMALEKRGIAHAYLYERSEGHGFWNEANRTAMYRKLLDFLDVHIGRKASAKS